MSNGKRALIGATLWGATWGGMITAPNLWLWAVWALVGFPAAWYAGGNFGRWMYERKESAWRD